MVGRRGSTRLRHVSDAEPGYVRSGRGRGIRYTDEVGAPLRRSAVLARIRALAIPPAWVDVLISPDPDAHLQATGRDGRDASSTATTRNGASSGTPRSSNASCGWLVGCRVFVASSTPTCAVVGYPATRCWPSWSASLS